jgi:hypothetical protein
VLQIDVVTGAGATGTVQVRNLVGLVILATCTDDCAVPVTAGGLYEIIATSPSKSQITGACSAANRCWFTAATGAQSATVTFSLDAAANEEWTVLLPEPIRAAAFDGSGNLIAAGTASLYKLAPAGTTIWTLPIAAKGVATGPGDTIYVHAGTEVRRLDPSGAAVWSSPIPAMALGCDLHEFVHCIAVGPDGEVAVRGTQGVARWSADGTPSWTRAAANDQNYTVAIDSFGVVSTTVTATIIPGDGLDLVQFAADGTPLPALGNFCVMYRGMLWLSGGETACTSSGHSSVYGIVRIEINDDPDWVPTGIAGTGIGHAGWVFYDYNSLWQFSWRMRRHDAASQLVWQKTGALIDNGIESIGTWPRDIAGSATGRLALVGAYDGFNPAPLRGFVTSFAP